MTKVQDPLEFHNKILSKLKKFKGVCQIEGYFENPNKYGDIISHIYFKFDVKDAFNFVWGEVAIDYGGNFIFLPGYGYKTFEKLNVSTVINCVADYFLLKKL